MEPTLKKYKLLKDMPDGSKPGDIYAPIESSGNVYKNESRSGRGKVGWTSVENNPEWFEEVKEQRIEVTEMFDLNNIYQEQCVRTGFVTSHPIPEEKFATIKKAIEQVINGEYDPERTPKYTQSEYDKAIEDAFEAAREHDPSVHTSVLWLPEKGHCYSYPVKYQTLKDYKTTLINSGE